MVSKSLESVFLGLEMVKTTHELLKHLATRLRRNANTYPSTSHIETIEVQLTFVVTFIGAKKKPYDFRDILRAAGHVFWQETLLTGHESH